MNDIENGLQNLSPSIPNIETSPHQRWISDSGTIYYRKTNDPVIYKEERDIYNSIDSDMIISHMILSKNGCPSIPYKNASSKTKNAIRAEFNTLKKEEGIIRKTGVRVKSSETGEYEVFIDSKYRMPWGKFEDYFMHMEKEQEVGKMAIFVPSDKTETLNILKENKYDSSYANIAFCRKVKDFDFFVLTIETTERSLLLVEWRLITEYLAMALGMKKEK